MVGDVLSAGGGGGLWHGRKSRDSRFGAHWRRLTAVSQMEELMLFGFGSGMNLSLSPKKLKSEDFR